jgi:hypothetical protein
MKVSEELRNINKTVSSVREEDIEGAILHCKSKLLNAASLNKRDVSLFITSPDRNMHQQLITFLRSEGLSVDTRYPYVDKSDLFVSIGW